jgi:hypothetical protein
LLISNGVTLTIEAGATVDLNGYYMLVNGTLRVMGNSYESVSINNGERIEFTEYSSDWDESGFGCILEYAVVHPSVILKSSSPKIHYCDLYRIVLEGQSSPVISYNNVDSILFESYNVVKGSPVISNNNVSRAIGSNTDMYGTPSTGAGSPTISHNIFTGEYPNSGIRIVANSPVIVDNVVADGNIAFTGDSVTILNNVVNGSVELEWCEGTIQISNNTITPPTRTIYSDVWIVPPYTARYFGIFIEGKNKLVDVVISNNTILGCSSGVKFGAIVGSVTIEGNEIRNNSEDGINFVADINLTIIDNFISNSKNGIKDYWGKGHMLIRNNTIVDNNFGISDPGHATIIDRNLIDDNDVALELGSQTTVQNNTITNSEVAIRLHDSPPVIINYNNIENCSENSILLKDTSINVDATNNWWGTSDIQAINLTIRDYKYDFELGKVSFTPVLMNPNTEATSYMIPEFPSWTFLSLFLIVTLAAVFCSKRFDVRTRLS